MVGRNEWCSGLNWQWSVESHKLALYVSKRQCWETKRSDNDVLPVSLSQCYNRDLTAGRPVKKILDGKKGAECIMSYFTLLCCSLFHCVSLSLFFLPGVSFSSCGDFILTKLQTTSHTTDRQTYSKEVSQPTDKQHKHQTSNVCIDIDTRKAIRSSRKIKLLHLLQILACR